MFDDGRRGGVAGPTAERALGIQRRLPLIQPTTNFFTSWRFGSLEKSKASRWLVGLAPSSTFVLALLLRNSVRVFLFQQNAGDVIVESKR